MFPRYLQYLLTDFRQTFVTGASWDTDDYVFGSKGQSSRSHHRGGGAQQRRVQLFLVLMLPPLNIKDWRTAASDSIAASPVRRRYILVLQFCVTVTNLNSNV